jgi:hypothetical protein
MPYASQAQSRFVHAKANQGVPWAEQFAADAQHGAGSVKRLPKKVRHKIGKKAHKPPMGNMTKHMGPKA